MANQFYVERDSQKFGPFSAAELKTLGTSHRIHFTDVVWREGGEKGILATRVTGLVCEARVTALPANVEVQILETTSPRAADDVAFQIVVPVIDPEPVFDLTHVEGTPVGIVADIVPEGLALKSMTDEPTDVLEVEEIEQTAGKDPEPKDHAADATPAKKTQRPSPPKAPVRKLRAAAIKGVIILSQDGEFVTFKKKCEKCKLEDNVTARMPLRSGPNRSNFFCQKCKKSREVLIQGSM